MKKMKANKKMSYGGLIHEDMSAPSNLPQEAKSFQYADMSYYSGDYDNSLTHLEGNVDQMAKNIKKHPTRGSY